MDLFRIVRFAIFQFCIDAVEFILELLVVDLQLFDFLFEIAGALDDIFGALAF